MEEFSILSKSTKIVLCFVSILIVGVRCQDNTNAAGGFINIDCGYEGEDYKDTLTGLTYTSDASFIDRGVTHNLSKEYHDSSTLPQCLATLRSFPNDSRICYAMRDLVPNAKYLIRTWFMYGNYDGLNSTEIQFDLHLGVNLCEKIYLSDSSFYTFSEVVTVAVSDVLTVCLVGQTGTLIISSLELRPLDTAMYPPLNVSNPALVLRTRENMGAPDDMRYPDDSYDRIWIATNDAVNWSAISTESRVSSPEDEFRAPSAVLQTAVVPAGNRTYLELSRDAYTEYYGNFSQYYVVMYFAEITSNETKRSFNIYLMSDDSQPPAYKQVTPQYLLANEISSPFAPSNNTIQLSIEQDKTSMYPPILNALEIYVLTSPTEVPTDVTDVAAITKIKEHYQLKRNWMGDPCAPKFYAWRGLDCSSPPAAPRIIALNLSSSGLTGDLADSFGNLTAITNLDLSENELTGTIPEFLADITSLKVLNLSRNNLIGSVPSALLSRSAKHTLTLIVDGNPNLCTDEALCPVAKKSTGNKRVVIISILLVIVIVMLLLLLLLFLLLCICKKRRKQQGNAPFQGEILPFTYLELQKITNNFEDELGKGGFGSVYRGRLETSGTEVAVKLLSQASAQGRKEFMAEVELLQRIHHRNLVSLVGYCNDGNYLALVYEYMSEGNLAEHLRGKTKNSRGLCWEERLQIALEAAEGLDYLHKGCDPPIIHRDVKTSNILLHKNLLTKIADFGLSKVFHNNDSTHLSTGVAGTPGYLDPEYHSTSQLTRKSDVYSFGVVLLELVTGQPPIIIQGPEKHRINIVQWIQPWIAQGDIVNLIDPTLEAKGGYAVDVVWKVIDIALNCTAASSAQRPDMDSVVAQLKEALTSQATVKEAPVEFTMEMRNMSVRRLLEISLIGGPSDDKETVVENCGTTSSDNKGNKETNRESFAATSQYKSLNLSEGTSSTKSSNLSKETSSVKVFSYLDIECATNGLSESSKIGQGGYGSVHKGYLDKVEVAIKMLDSKSKQGLEEFTQELDVLGQIRHPNLVKLIGACFRLRCLVYEFLPNGSLEDCLKKTPRLLTWQMRTRIVSEICSALIFLHSNKLHPLVHGDIKPHNILLDVDFNSKLADFGLCRFLPEGTSTIAFLDTKPKGTLEYIDPVFLETGILTALSDVYSFGVTILRLLTGMEPLGIVMKVRAAYKGKSLMTMVDSTAGHWPTDVAGFLAKFGLECRNKKKSSELLNWISADLEDILQVMCSSPILN